jgi:hypothetical protein
LGGVGNSDQLNGLILLLVFYIMLTSDSCLLNVLGFKSVRSLVAYQIFVVENLIYGALVAIW